MISKLINKGKEIDFDITKIKQTTKDAIFTLYNDGTISGGQIDILMDKAYINQNPMK